MIRRNDSRLRPRIGRSYTRGEKYTLDAGKEGRRDAGTYGKQGLYKLAHNAAEDEAYEDGEQQWTMTPEPYPPAFPSENVTVRPPLKKMDGVYFRICLACKYRTCLYELPRASGP